MSTKASVASSKWSESFNSFSREKRTIRENKVNPKCVNVPRSCPKKQKAKKCVAYVLNPENKLRLFLPYEFVYLPWVNGSASAELSKWLPILNLKVAYYRVTYLRYAPVSPVDVPAVPDP